MIKSFKSRQYRFLSNAFGASFQVDGVWYRTVEHYLQAHRTTVPFERAQIRMAQTPTEAKELGSTAGSRSDWEAIGLDVLRRGVRAKFEQNPVLRQRLLDTEDEQLKEDETEQTGLGQVLMETRDQLRSSK